MIGCYPRPADNFADSRSCSPSSTALSIAGRLAGRRGIHACVPTAFAPRLSAMMC